MPRARVGWMLRHHKWGSWSDPGPGPDTAVRIVRPQSRDLDCAPALFSHTHTHLHSMNSIWPVRFYWKGKMSAGKNLRKSYSLAVEIFRTFSYFLMGLCLSGLTPLLILSLYHKALFRIMLRCLLICSVGSGNPCSLHSSTGSAACCSAPGVNCSTGSDWLVQQSGS